MSNLTGMNEAGTPKARPIPIYSGGGITRRNFRARIAPGEPFGSLLLQLTCKLFHRDCFENILGGGGKEREHGIGTILLVLLKTSS